MKLQNDFDAKIAIFLINRKLNQKLKNNVLDVARI